MKQGLFQIIENIHLTDAVMKMRLAGDTSAITASGQFVNIRLEGKFLRRPISVCDCTDGELTLLYKIVGDGTAQMSRMAPGEELDILSGLGNGYDLSLSGKSPLLIGGGVGVPPMYMLAKELLKLGKTVTVILGFNTASEVFYKQEFEDLGCRVYVATVDGTAGTRGFVTDVMRDLDYTYFYTCGPEPMFRAIFKTAKTSGQFSFEERMGCGFGACMGCSCKTVTGYKRICKEGPVMKKEELIWQI